MKSNEFFGVGIFAIIGGLILLMITKEIQFFYLFAVIAAYFLGLSNSSEYYEKKIKSDFKRNNDKEGIE